MRLIDADALLKSYDVAWMYEYDETGCGVRRKAIPIKCVEEAPTIDAEPVRPATYDARGDCTNCGYPMPIEDKRDVIYPGEVKYCYHCGAKMDGG